MSNNEDVDVYNVLSRHNTGFYSQTPKVYLPTPGPPDYFDGYIMRFFIQRGNDRNGPIVEISEHSAKLFKDNPFYTKVSISWKITGPPNTITREGVEHEEGVSEHNYRRANLANETIMGIGDKLSDVYQFYKPS
jgi:hypothetical protein